MIQGDKTARRGNLGLALILGLAASTVGGICTTAIEASEASDQRAEVARLKKALDLTAVELDASRSPEDIAEIAHLRAKYYNLQVKTHQPFDTYSDPCPRRRD